MSTGNGVGNFENFAISAWVFCYFTDSNEFLSDKTNVICHKNLIRILKLMKRNLSCVINDNRRT